MQQSISLFLFIALFTFHVVILPGQTPTTGPVIADYGAVFAIENPDFKIAMDREFKAVFDVMESPETHGSVNAGLETAARFLNMHARAGIPVEQLKVALVVHHAASKDILSDVAYRKRYGTDNPNQKLVQAILGAGGQVILCGQSAAGRGIAREEPIPNVQLALSAMTALIQLQDEGYRLIKF